MKYLSLIIFSFILTCGYAQKNFAPLGAEWQYGVKDDSPECFEIRYRVVADTIIDTKDCSVISSNSGRSDQFNNYELIVYEENGRVFFYELDSFYLLFDFTVVEGDTVEAFIPPALGFHPYDDLQNPLYIPYTISEVGEVIINDIPRKSFITTPIYDAQEFGCITPERIIENIGSTSEFLIGYHCSVTLPPGCLLGSGFICYTNDSIDYNTGESRCNLISSIEELTTLDIQVYPNPFSSSVSIKGDMLINHRVFIKDLQGRTVLTTSKLTDINTSALKSGVYYLQLVNKDYEVVGIERIVKM